MFHGFPTCLVPLFRRLVIPAITCFTSSILPLLISCTIFVTRTSSLGLVTQLTLVVTPASSASPFCALSRSERKLCTSHQCRHDLLLINLQSVRISPYYPSRDDSHVFSSRCNCIRALRAVQVGGI